MNSAIVRLATVSDIGILVLHDRHVSKNILEQAVEARHVMVIEEDGDFAGWLRWSLFWDSIPFLNMLFLLQLCMSGWSTGLCNAIFSMWMRRSSNSWSRGQRSAGKRICGAD